MWNFIKRHRLLISGIFTFTILVSILGVQLEYVPNNRGFTIGQGSVVLKIGTAEASGTVDYVCDGTDDDIQFQGALDALPANGGTIEILAGNYDVGATVTRAIDNVTIVGTGRGTYITFNGVNYIFTAGGNNWQIKDLRTDAGSINMGATTGWSWENITVNATYYAYRTDDATTASSWNIPTGRGATYIIAAYDAPAHVKAQADYVCDGTADDVQIESALNVDTTKDVYIRLVGGLFTIASELTITGSEYRTITIEGDSPSLDYRYYTGTTIKLVDNANCNMFANADDISFRSLFLRNISLDGNNANNTSGNGIYANNHLLMGDWQHAGLFNLSIQNFDESGINVPAGETTGLCMQSVNVGFNGEYGVYITYGQGVNINSPCWFHDNGKTNLFGATLADTIIDGLHIENGAEYGAYLSLQHSVVQIWTATTEWQGVVLDSCDTATIDIFVRGACTDLTGCPLSGYPQQVFITNGSKALSGSIVVDEYGAQNNVDALGIHSVNYCNLDVNLYAKRYALNIAAPQLCAGNTITGVMRAVTQPTIYWNPAVAKNNTAFLFNNIQGSIWPGEVQTYRVAITAGGAGTKTAWQNPCLQDCMVVNVTVRLTTGDADASNGDCGVVADATTVGTDIFADLTCETAGVYYSYTAAGGGTQTLPIVLNAAGGANDYLTFTLSDNDGTSVVGYIYITIVGI